MLLIYAAFAPQARFPVMASACIEKTGYAVFVFGSAFRKRAPAAIIAGGDCLIVMIYCFYLLSDRVQGII